MSTTIYFITVIGIIFGIIILIVLLFICISSCLSYYNNIEAMTIEDTIINNILTRDESNKK